MTCHSVLKNLTAAVDIAELEAVRVKAFLRFASAYHILEILGFREILHIACENAAFDALRRGSHVNKVYVIQVIREGFIGGIWLAAKVMGFVVSRHLEHCIGKIRADSGVKRLGNHEKIEGKADGDYRDEQASIPEREQEHDA